MILPPASPRWSRPRRHRASPRARARVRTASSRLRRARTLIGLGAPCCDAYISTSMRSNARHAGCIPGRARRASLVGEVQRDTAAAPRHSASTRCPRRSARSGQPATQARETEVKRPCSLIDLAAVNRTHRAGTHRSHGMSSTLLGSVRLSASSNCALPTRRAALPRVEGCHDRRTALASRVAVARSRRPHPSARTFGGGRA